MEEEDRQKLTDLVKELVLRLLDTDPSIQLFQSSYLYSLRILSSRLLSSPSLLDPLSLSDSIKRRLASCGKSSLALSFHDLFSRFSSLSGPGSVNNKPSLLLLLHIISLDRSSSSPAVVSIPDPLERFDRAGVPGDKADPLNGVMLIEKDPENLRDLAFREYVDLAREEFEVSEGVLVRDVLYACQGIDGKFVKFGKFEDGYVLSDVVRVTRSARVLVRKLCELGRLFRKVRNYVSDCMDMFSCENGLL